ncbi:hypothetical protein [Paenibacillus sacheonensis]|uniref:Uncharacterized protein n=1 Tax=Paenibacillus sacheonensis TaxID=742054 RepID=A0A7X4YXR7_9BACL|nr:hypothetical protein [Paenibacillus sacheonensis]MBM7569522.1 hypothetical protein [Paenibacillus sacheonensis]NBC73581.1 hypothetical protein [Paenibacillus sacheonensis]
MDRGLQYKHIHLYCDEKKNEATLVPNGWHEKLGVVLIDIVEVIPLPFFKEELFQASVRTFNNCFTKEPPAHPAKDDNPLVSKLGNKNWSAATRGKKLIVIDWTKDKGYIVYPTKRGHGGFYQHLTDKGVCIGKELEAEALLNAVQDSLYYSLR